MMNNTQRLNTMCAMLIIWSVFKQSWGALTDEIYTLKSVDW